MKVLYEGKPSSTPCSYTAHPTHHLHKCMHNPNRICTLYIVHWLAQLHPSLTCICATASLSLLHTHAEYEPHGVKVLYEGKPVELTPEQEEVASMFAIMKETDYMSKPTFLKNFWEGFKEVRRSSSSSGSSSSSSSSSISYIGHILRALKQRRRQQQHIGWRR